MSKGSFRIEAVPGKQKRGDSFGIGNARVYKREIDRAVEYTLQAVKRDLEKTVQTWNKKPEFVTESKYQGGSRIITAYTDNQVYNWLDQGTKPHIIRPKRARMLAFQSGYTAKTSAAPGAFIAKSGGPSGAWRYAKQVNHPGTKARKFYQKIQLRNQKRLEMELETALALAAKAGKE